MANLMSWFKKSIDLDPPNPKGDASNSAVSSSQKRETPWGQLSTFAVFGALVVVAYTFTRYQQAAFFLTVALASMVIGLLLGFLFGVPHTIQTEDDQSARNATAETQKPTVRYKANTNLEQISDWLTKILVGVGLTQLSKIPEKLGRLGDFLAAGAGGTSAERSFGILVFLFFSGCGFLVGFLWTRLYLQKEFRDADLGVLALAVLEIKSQPDKDARALSLVLRQLSPAIGTPAPTEEELNKAIKDASASMRLLIFEQARIARKPSSPNQQLDVERTIPIFKALIAADDEPKQFHRNYGQLGYVMKEKTPPDYQAAIDALSRAIEIRDRLHIAGYQLYELNRALCLIKLFPAANDDQKQRIIADLKAVQKSDPGFRSHEPDFDMWLTQHNIQL